MSVAVTTVRDDTLVARNPATGEELGRVEATPPKRVGELVSRARVAQGQWAALGWPDRRRVLDRWRRVLSRDADAWASLICSEVGKPRLEAMGGEVLSSLDAIRWTVRHAGSALAEQRIGPAWQRAMLMPAAVCRWVPYGVIGMLGTWNYPLFLNAPPIAQALAAGNAVVYKTSESAPLCGRKLEESLAEAGIPDGLVAVVQGGPEVGRAVVESSVDKVMFTGGIEGGRHVLEAAGRRGVPALAELSGFDPAIVLPDVPLESTVRALTWAAFVGCGQTCVAVKRVFVVGDAGRWADALAASARALRVGDPARPGVNVGPMISHRARARLQAMIDESVARGASVLAGGQPLDGAGSFYPPTVLLADSARAEDALAGAFGPLVIVRRGRDRGRCRVRRQSRRLCARGQRLEPRSTRGRAAWETAPGRHRRRQRRGHAHRARWRPVRRRAGQRLRPDQGPPRPARVRPAPGGVLALGGGLSPATVPLSGDAMARAVLLHVPHALPSAPVIASSRTACDSGRRPVRIERFRLSKRGP